MVQNLWLVGQTWPARAMKCVQKDNLENFRFVVVRVNNKIMTSTWCAFILWVHLEKLDLAHN